MIELNGPLEVFLGGALGPFLVELLRIANWRNRTAVSLRYARLAYCVATAALLATGGIVAILYGVESVPIVRAAHLGATAPLLVGAWASSAPREPTSALSAPLATRVPLRNLLAW